MNIDYDDEENSLWVELKDTINYIITNYHKFILLIIAFFIIYFVDYVSNINAFLYNGQSILGLQTPTSPLQSQIKIQKLKPKQKNKKK